MRLSVGSAIFALLLSALVYGQGSGASGQDTASTSAQQSPSTSSATASGASPVAAKDVSKIPLNKRDFTQLLTLASGTTTDVNGSANFTQQFAVNGQRGTTAVFAIDGLATSDPEMGGATFANFNVDAIEDLVTQSGVMPAEIGEGAAGFTNLVTKSGTPHWHGSAFEFLRNAALDARNFFDRRSAAQPRRIPPFIRNEFGMTVGGPVPSVLGGAHKAYFFAEYQGFRQVLGTTQVLSVPTPAERKGLDTTAFAGDTLFVPVNPAIAGILARYPLPNDPGGAYGPRTFATSSKVATDSDQISARSDRNLSRNSTVFARFTWDNITGPTTDPSQTAIDPSFALNFFNHQRNAGVALTHSFSPNVTSESSIDFIRTTPSFFASNGTQSGISFSDGLYEGFNTSAGQRTEVWGNLFQLRQNISWTRGSHSFKGGFETRWDRDSAVFGLSPSGLYTFGGGTAYSPVTMQSASGTHNIASGAPLPDTLSAFLTASPQTLSVQVAPPPFPGGERIGMVGVFRESYNFFFQDSWKATPSLALNYGLRFEASSRIHEPNRHTSGPIFFDASGHSAGAWTGTREGFVFDPEPPYKSEKNGWGPRLSVDWQVRKATTLHAAAGITTLLTNLYNDDNLTDDFPFEVSLFYTARPRSPVAFQTGVVRPALPPIYSVTGQRLFINGSTSGVPANTELDVDRFERELAAMTPGNQSQALEVFGMESDYHNGYIETYTAGVEHRISDFNLSASYVATQGVKLASMAFPNAYPAADPGFARFSEFNSAGQVIGGYGPEMLLSDHSHSTYHSLQTSISKTSARAGLGLQASYTLGKALDDASSVLAPTNQLASGVLAQAYPQDPRNPGADKGPATFDIRHVVTFNAVQVLPFDHLRVMHVLPSALTSGWQLLNVSTITSGLPFTVYSGLQQTGVGTLSTDRPDQIGTPVLSVSRSVREDYFGAGANNGQFFYIPVNLPGGTGPNHGRFGTLGRNTFRGPEMHQFDLSLIKDTPLKEGVTLEFRAECFNAFNIVNFGLPANILRGSGFGVISSTAGPSRQLQFSLKILY